MTVLDRMASTVKSDRAFLNNQRPFRLAAFFQRVTGHALPCIRKLVYLSRLRAIPSPHATGHCPPRAGRRRGERVRRRRLTVTSSLTKIRQLRSCAPILSITSSGIEFFCDASFAARRIAASAFSSGIPQLLRRSYSRAARPRSAAVPASVALPLPASGSYLSRR